MNTVEALKELYKSFGGKLTDTYSNIADGIPVGNYSVIPDCFAALAEIAGGSIELPVVTQADAGDVLTVGEDGKWTNAEPTKELPTVTTEDAGDVLTVNAEGKWTNEEPAKELPTVTASDNGSVLSVVDGAWAKNDKTFVKDTPINLEESGATIIPITNIVNHKNSIVVIKGVLSGASGYLEVDFSSTSNASITWNPTSPNAKLVIEFTKLDNSNNYLVKAGNNAEVVNIYSANLQNLKITPNMTTFTSGTATVYTQK